MPQPILATFTWFWYISPVVGYFYMHHCTPYLLPKSKSNEKCFLQLQPHSCTNCHFLSELCLTFEAIPVCPRNLLTFFPNSKNWVSNVSKLGPTLFEPMVKIIGFPHDTIKPSRPNLRERSPAPSPARPEKAGFGHG